MASEEKQLKAWVAERLHSLLGFADGNVASFILAVAKKHTAAGSLAAALHQQGLPTSQETLGFAGELLGRLPRKATGPSTYAVQQKVARAFVKKNASYDLLQDDGSEAAAKAAAAAEAAEAAAAVAAAAAAASASSNPATNAKEGKHLRSSKSVHFSSDDPSSQNVGVHQADAYAPGEPTARRGTGRGSDDEDDTVVRRPRDSSRAKRRWEEDEEDDGEGEGSGGRAGSGKGATEEERATLARENDLLEKQEFEERLRAKDDGKTKKTGNDGSKLSKAEQREADRRK